VRQVQNSVAYSKRYQVSGSRFMHCTPTSAIWNTRFWRRYRDYFTTYITWDAASGVERSYEPCESWEECTWSGRPVVAAWIFSLLFSLQCLASCGRRLQIRYALGVAGSGPCGILSTSQKNSFAARLPSMRSAEASDCPSNPGLLTRLESILSVLTHEERMRNVIAVGRCDREREGNSENRSQR
jgi:hypothetical protein